MSARAKKALSWFMRTASRGKRPTRKPATRSTAKFRSSRATRFLTSSKSMVCRKSTMPRPRPSAILCPHIQLHQEPREENASYIAPWLEALKNDNRAIFTAAAHAQRAADYLHSFRKSATDAAQTPEVCAVSSPLPRQLFRQYSVH